MNIIRKKKNLTTFWYVESFGEARMVAKAFERIWCKVCEISELVGNVGKQFDSMKQ